MARTLVMMMSIIGLLVSSVTAIMLLMVSNWILSPIYNIFERLWPETSLLTPGDLSWIPTFLWVVIVLMWIVCLITFMITIRRDNEVGYESYL